MSCQIIFQFHGEGNRADLLVKSVKHCFYSMDMCTMISYYTHQVKI